MNKLVPALAAAGFTLGVVHTPHSDASELLVGFDFDTVSPDNTNLNSNARVNATIGVDANGVGGSQGFFLNMDTTPVLTNPGFAQANTTLIDVAIDTSAYTSTDPNDYTLSFDALVEGLLPTATSTGVNVELFFNNGGPGFTWNNVAVTDTYTTFSLNPATANSADPVFDVSGSSIANVKFTVLFPDNSLGTDTGNALRIDNVVLTLTSDPPVIPEPASAALLALGGLLLMRRRS